MNLCFIRKYKNIYKHMKDYQVVKSIKYHAMFYFTSLPILDKR